VAIGSSRGAVNEARDILAKRGIPIDYMRIKAFPFTKEVEAFLASHEKIFVVEQNRDAQLRSLLTLETAVPKSKLHSILHYNGLPMTSRGIVEAVLAELGDAQRAAALA
jgi:2-oxoglutarate ferredoxin oxidoreductase subunit alpha